MTRMFFLMSLVLAFALTASPVAATEGAPGDPAKTAKLCAG